MRRWFAHKRAYGTNRKVDEFLKDVETSCRTFGLTIAHEDSGGSFVIVPYNEDLATWLQNATWDVRKPLTRLIWLGVPVFGAMFVAETVNQNRPPPALFQPK